jgi:hypothetical protein
LFFLVPSWIGTLARQTKKNTNSLSSFSTTTSSNWIAQHTGYCSCLHRVESIDRQDKQEKIPVFSHLYRLPPPRTELRSTQPIVLICTELNR